MAAILDFQMTTKIQYDTGAPAFSLSKWEQ